MKMPYGMIQERTMTLHQALVTPDQAAEMLDNKDARQRIKKPMLVEYLAKCITDGEWDSDMPQPAMLSEQNRLLDGQHRLEAIVATGTPALVWFALNVPARCYVNIDSGISRPLHDRVMLTPESPGSNKTACTIVTQYWFHENQRRGRPTPEQAQDTFNEHESAIRWCLSALPHERGIGRAQVALALAQMYERDAEKARRFADTVWGGDMRRPNGIRLREFLLKAVGIDKRTLAHGGSIARYIYETCVYFCKAELSGTSPRRTGTAQW